MSAIHKINRASQLFQPITSTFQNAKKADKISKSYEYLTRHGIIKPVNNGLYALLPLGSRVMNKLIDLVDNEMREIGAQKLQFPAMTSCELLKRTNKYTDNEVELFKIKDRHNRQYVLSPTYEEMICDLLSTMPLSAKNLPLKLYQISSKWRDEMKPRLGFLRSKEFLMKDLYTFDTTIDNAKETYELVCKAYDKIFQKIGIPITKAIGDTGSIGGIMSHEYHYKSSIGEDIVHVCPSCHYSVNQIVCNDLHCPQCSNEFVTATTAEVAHTFLLDTQYTKPLKATYTSSDNKPVPLVMGCYGLGLTRIFSVAVEILSTETELRWPKCLAPYTVCVITAKDGSKEESGSQYVNQVLDVLNQLNIDTIFDDRTQLTIGNRLLRARLTGYPYVIILGKCTMKSPPQFEIHNIYKSTQCDLTLENLYSYFKNECTES